jgi:hypothetical protein
VNTSQVRVISCLLLSAFLVRPPATANCDEIDQEYLVPPESTSILGSLVNSEFDHAQTFTVGKSGVLARIELGVYLSGPTTDDLTVDIRPITVTGYPVSDNAMTLFSTRVPPEIIPKSDSFNFLQPFNSVVLDVRTSNIVVKAGDQLAIVARSPSPIAYHWWMGSSRVADVYDRGTSFYREGGSIDPWISNDFLPFYRDNHFRTFIVPEPQSLLLASGFGISLLLNVNRLMGRRREVR